MNKCVCRNPGFCFLLQSLFTVLLFIINTCEKHTTIKAPARTRNYPSQFKVEILMIQCWTLSFSVYVQVLEVVFFFFFSFLSFFFFYFLSWRVLQTKCTKNEAASSAAWNKVLRMFSWGGCIWNSLDTKELLSDLSYLSKGINAWALYKCHVTQKLCFGKKSLSRSRKLYISSRTKTPDDPNCCYIRFIYCFILWMHQHLLPSWHLYCVRNIGIWEKYTCSYW